MVRLTRKYLSEGSVIVYATTRSTVEHVYEYLKEQDDLKGKVAKYHAGLRQEKKEKVLVSFFSGKRRSSLPHRHSVWGSTKRMSDWF